MTMMQPAAELIAKLPVIAATTWKQRKERIEQERRQLTSKLKEEKALNQRAIEARIKGYLAAEDFDTMKAHIKGSIQSIESELKALDSEGLTMESMMSEAAESVLNLAKTWLEADLARRQELQNALFPEGLRFSNDLLLFDPGNHTLMTAVTELLSTLELVGVPDGI